MRLLHTVCFAYKHGVTLESICRDHTRGLMEFSHHALTNGITETTPIILYRENCITVTELCSWQRSQQVFVWFTAGVCLVHSRCLSGLQQVFVWFTSYGLYLSSNAAYAFSIRSFSSRNLSMVDASYNSYLTYQASPSLTPQKSGFSGG